MPIDNCFDCGQTAKIHPQSSPWPDPEIFATTPPKLAGEGASCGCRTVARAVAGLAAAGQVYFKISTLAGLGNLARLICQDLSVEGVLFGSSSPLFCFEPPLFKVREAGLTEAQQTAVFEQTARRLLGKL